MGIGGIGIWQLLIILLIVVMLFGTKKLRNIGSDLGGALKGFKSAMKDDGAKQESSDEESESSEEPKEPSDKASDATAKKEEKEKEETNAD